MRPSTFRNIIKKLGIVVLEHLIFLIIYGLLFSSSVALVSTDSVASANNMLLIMALICHVAFFAVFFGIKTSFLEYRRDLKEKVREDGFSLFSYYKSEILSEDLIVVAIFTVLQIPFAFFYGSFGYLHVGTSAIERIYSLDAGIYAVTGSAILGFILNALIFTLIYAGVHLAFVAATVRSVKENILK